MPALPASEVRRRGDLLRRRRRARAAVAGALAALAVLAAPIAVLAERAEPRPPYAGSDRPTRIPSAFPLDAGLRPAGHPQPTTVGEQVLPALVVCDREVWSPEAAGVLDTLGAEWSDGVEGGEQRTLAVLGSDRAAQDVLDAVRGRVAGCPDPAPGRAGVHPVLLRTAAGRDAVAYVDRYRDRAGLTGEGTAYLLVRVGNLALLSRSYVGGVGDPAVAQQAVDLLADRSTVVVAAMRDLVG